MALDLNTRKEFLLTLAAKEGGWTTHDLDHNMPLNNPFGRQDIDHGVAIGNHNYSSLDMAVRDWEAIFGNRVRGAQTMDSFAFGLQHPPAGNAYNTVNPHYESDLRNLYSTMLKYMQRCGIQ